MPISEYCRLIVFMKNPELGRVKTRLAKTVGAQMALDVYNYLLEKTRNATQDLKCNKAVYYSKFVDQDDDWSNDVFDKFVQKGEDLGKRMWNAFSEAFDQGFERVMIIGSDCPQLTQEIIEMGFDLLENVDFVIGPAKDGGYYLLGMKTPFKMLFEDKEWSTDSVFEDTIMDIVTAGKKYAKLPMLADLDDAYDLHLVKNKFK